MPRQRHKTTGFAQVLEELRKTAGSNGTTRGRLFERLTKSFLQGYDLYRGGSERSGCGTSIRTGKAG